MAHDKSLRQTGVDVSSEPVESVLLMQVDQLAAQIIKTKDETLEEAKGPASMNALTAKAMARGMDMKAIQGMLRGNSGSIVRSGVNF